MAEGEASPAAMNGQEDADEDTAMTEEIFGGIDFGGVIEMGVAAGDFLAGFTVGGVIGGQDQTADDEEVGLKEVNDALPEEGPGEFGGGEKAIVAFGMEGGAGEQAVHGGDEGREAFASGADDEADEQGIEEDAAVSRKGRIDGVEEVFESGGSVHDGFLSVDS